MIKLKKKKKVGHLIAMFSSPQGAHLKKKYMIFSLRQISINPLPFPSSVLYASCEAKLTPFFPLNCQT